MDIVSRCVNSILNIFESFNGVGFVFVVFLMCIAFLSIKEKNAYIKDALVKYPLYVLVVFFCPIWWLYIYYVHNEEILYRILWIMPIGIVVVYSLTKITDVFTGVKRFAAYLCCMVLIMASGKYIYANEIFTPAENIYHVPQTVVKICDEIIVDGREILCCFPDEMVTYVRQYTPYVCMPYGRDVLFDYVQGDEDLRTIINMDVVDTMKAVEKLRELNTPYLVVNKETDFSESLSTYDFIFVTEIDGYEIYLDNEAYLGLDFIDYR